MSKRDNWNYWDECIEASFLDNGITATDEQIQAVSGDVEVSHENYGLVSPTPPNPLVSELEETKRALAKQCAKIICKECGGGGRIITHGPVHSGDGQCWKCRGDGLIDP